jgi:hypothetical protein
MPIGGTNSAVISAACHVRHMDEQENKKGEDIVHRPLQWGVAIEGTEDKVGHCCFSDEEVQRPIKDCVYA